jgi:hypothetical protein
MTQSLIKTKTIKAVLFSDYYIEQTKHLLKEVVFIVSYTNTDFNSDTLLTMK